MRTHPVLISGLLTVACVSPSEPGRGAEVSGPVAADSLASNGDELDCDLVHLELDLRLDYDEKRISGTATSWVRALPGGCAQVRLHGAGLEVHEVTDGRGRSLSFDHEGDVIQIRLAERLATGDEERLAVAYTARDPKKGMVFLDGDPGPGFAPEIWTQGQFEDNRYWMPVWDLPNDRTTVDLSVRVGHGMTAVSCGELLGVESSGRDERTFRWRLAERIPTYLIAIAAGRWETYGDRVGELPLGYHVPPGTGEETARAIFHETPAMMRFFEELFDEPYPYAKYDQAIVAGFPWQGMENASITILYDELLGGPDALLDLDGNPRLLIAHELAHHWFGDLVTCRDWSHLWLNEAWASYLELIWEREVTSDANFRLWLQRYAEWYFERGDDCAVPMALDWHSQHCAKDRAHHVYVKGPWVLHMLERKLGEEAFWAGTRAYLDDHKDGLVTTSDFVTSIFDATGRNVEGFCEQWVLLGGHPVLEVEAEARGGQVVVTVRQVQEFRGTVPRFRFPLVIELTDKAGRKVHPVEIESIEEEFRFPLVGELYDLNVDPEGDLLAEITVKKDRAARLRQAARFESPVLQWRAVPWLASQEDLDPRRSLERMATESEQPLLRERATLALGELSVPVLVERMVKDEAARVRRAAGQRLLVARPELTPKQRRMLKNHIRSERSPRAIELLEALLGDEE